MIKLPSVKNLRQHRALASNRQSGTYGLKYQIKQRLLSLTDSFDIQDDAGNLAFSVKGKLFSLTSSQTLYDSAERELLKIKRKYLSLLPACRLLCQDGSEWQIRKRFWPFWTSRFSISSPLGDLEISGNLWQHEYEIRQHTKVLASISKRWFSWTDTYGVDIQAPQWTVQLLACVIVIDRIQHSDSSSD